MYPAHIFSSVVIFLFQVLKMTLNRDIDNYHHIHYNNFSFHGVTAPTGPMPPHYRGYTITLRHTHETVGLLWTSDQPYAETSA